MPKRFLQIAALVLAAAAGAFAADGWRRVATPNFEVSGDASDADLIATATRLEQFRASVAAIFPRMKFATTVPTRVVVFGDRAAFDRIRPVEWADGFLQSSEDLTYIVLPAGRADGFRFATVYHEYAHFLIENTLGRPNVPPWLNEGVAEYYETTTPSADALAAVVGAPPAGHLELLRRARPLASDILFRTDYYTLRKQTKESAQLFYATSWLLADWLVARGRFDAVLDAASTGVSPRAAIGLDDAALDAELARFLAAGKFATRTAPLAAAPAFDAAPRALSAAESAALEGDLQMRVGKLDDAERTLRAALALEPASAAANTSLGLLLVARGRYVAAREFLLRATESPAANYRAHFAYAYALARAGTTEFGFAIGFAPADAAEIVAHVRRAIALRPDYAESYNLFAFVAYVRNEDIDEALAMIGRALAIAPGNQTYQLRLAELRMRREEFEEARRIARRVLDTAASDQTKLYAENTLRTIISLEQQLRAIRDGARGVDDDTVTDKPLSDEEIARRRERALLEALNQTLRRPRAGEKRLLAAIDSIDCAPGRVSVGIRDAEGPRRLLRADSLDRVLLVSYAPEFVNFRFGCGAVPKDNLAVVTFRPTGEIVSVEFVPAGFRLLN